MNTKVLQAKGVAFTVIDEGQGPAVLLLHGFPDTHVSYHHQIKALVAAGYRCIAPVMRGYEPSSIASDSSVQDYRLVALASDLPAWLDALELDKVHLVGHDWGAVVSYAAVAAYPQRFHSLTTLAIPHISSYKRGVMRYPIQLLKSSYMLFFQLTGVAEWLLRLNNFRSLNFLWRQWSPSLRDDEQELQAVKQAFSRPGVLTETLRYYRALRLLDQASLDLSSQPIEVPTLAITGAEDGCIDTRLFELMDCDLFPAGLRIERFEGAGHFLHLEQPQQLNRLLLSWLQQQDEVVEGSGSGSGSGPGDLIGSAWVSSIG